jgi:hypothetical protein
MSRESIFVVGDGAVTALAGGPLSLADMGERTTRRASHLEFCPERNVWVVLSADIAGELYEHPDYDVALRWEINHFNRRLSIVG